MGSAASCVTDNKEAKAQWRRPTQSHRGRHDPDPRDHQTDDPLKTATECLSEKKTPSISIIALTLAKLQEDFELDVSNLPVISVMKNKFRKDFDAGYTYIQDLLNRALHFIPCSKTWNSGMMTTPEAPYSWGSQQKWREQ